MSDSPILVTGADRSGTTLLYSLLASHPDVMMVRRTNLWRWFDQRFGDLAETENLDACLREMMRYRRLDVLDIRADQVIREFRTGAPTYGRLFEIAFRQAADRRGVARWGDKSLHVELSADRVLEEWPSARIVQLIRDPRDRYASVVGRRGTGSNSDGSIMGRWLKSVRMGERAVQRHPASFKMLRFEDLVHEPEEQLREVCAFVDVDFNERMFRMDGGDDRSAAGSNSSFDNLPQGTISRKPIGRYRDHLDPVTISTIDAVAARPMRRWSYSPETVNHSGLTDSLSTGARIVAASARIAAWTAVEKVLDVRGRRVPENRLRDSG